MEATKIAGSPIGFKIGRQQISYGDQRVFGPGQWGNTGRYAWDAAMLKVDTGRLGSELWAGRFVRNRAEIWPIRPFPAPTAVVSYNRLEGLPLRLDLFYALKHDNQATIPTEPGTVTLQSHSIGIQAQGTTARVLDYAGTYVRQFGRLGRYDLNAFGLNVSTGITFSLPWSPRLAGQFTQGSGDPDPAGGSYRTFDGIFGGADIMFYGYLLPNAFNLGGDAGDLLRLRKDLALAGGPATRAWARATASMRLVRLRPARTCGAGFFPPCTPQWGQTRVRRGALPTRAVHAHR